MHLSLLFISLLCVCIHAIQLNDLVIVKQLDGTNKTLVLANEAYIFKLVPRYYVPSNIIRHTVWTASKEANNAEIQSIIDGGGTPNVNNKKRGMHNHPYLTPTQYQELQDALADRGVRVKRSAVEEALDENTTTTIYQIDEKAHVTVRRGAQVQFGTKICLHIPWITTCDNSADVDSLKDALNAMNNELHAELDDIRATMDKRAAEIANSLNTQRGLISKLAQETDNLADAVSVTANVVKVQHSDLTNGLIATHKQIWHLQNSVNVLNRAVQLMLSTDNRLVTAQPALTELFKGFKDTVGMIQNNSWLPILMNGDSFDFPIYPLPAASIRNTAGDPTKTVQGATSAYVGIKILYTEALDTPVFGMLPLNLSGIFCNLGACDSIAAAPLISSDMPFNLSTKRNDNLFCVSFYSSLLLITINPNLFRTTVKPVLRDLYDCSDLLLNATDGKGGVTAYMMINQGYYMPFYSNCDYLNKSGLPILGTLLWQIFLPRTDVFTRNWITKDCYISIPPENIGLSYYFDTTPQYISQVDRGFEVDQFAINRYGEISSSLSFLYTYAWLPVYGLSLISPNSIMIDEVSSLGTLDVLWNISGDFVTDAADSFFGEGNNGRDCVRSYRPDGTIDNNTLPWTNCFFQNLGTQYPVQDYFAGRITSSGITRFNNKMQTVFYQDIFGDWYVNATARENVEFLFYVQEQNNRCPTVFSKEQRQGSCYLKFQYKGVNNITVVNKATKQRELVTFDSGRIGEKLLSAGDFLVNSNGQSCFQITCTIVSTSSYVTVTTPDVTVVAKSDTLSVGAIQDMISVGLGDARLNSIIKAANETQQNLKDIMAQLAELNFTTQYQFKDFTAERAAVQAKIDAIQTNSETSCNLWCKFSTAAAFIVIAFVIFFVIRTVIAITTGGQSFGAAALGLRGK